MIPAEPATHRRGAIARLSLDRKTVSLCLPLFAIVCAWLLELLTLSRMKLVAGLGLTQLVQGAVLLTVVTWGVILALLKHPDLFATEILLGGSDCSLHLRPRPGRSGNSYTAGQCRSSPMTKPRRAGLALILRFSAIPF